MAAKGTDQMVGVARATFSLRMPLGTFLLVSAELFSAAHLHATSVVALIDQLQHRVVIAADCRVNKNQGSVSACKIIQDEGCTAAIAGLYHETSTDFHLQQFVHLACQEPGDLRTKADAFLRISQQPFEQAVKAIHTGRPADFAKTIANKPTEVVFAGIQDGGVALIVRGLVADSTGIISVERFESIAPTYSRMGYFIGLNGHIRRYLKAHPGWINEDYAELAPKLVHLEIQAHPDLAGLPISVLQIDNKGEVVWLAKGACDTANQTTLPRTYDPETRRGVAFAGSRRCRRKNSRAYSAERQALKVPARFRRGKPRNVCRRAGRVQSATANGMSIRTHLVRRYSVTG